MLGEAQTRVRAVRHGLIQILDFRKTLSLMEEVNKLSWVSGKYFAPKPCNEIPIKRNVQNILLLEGTVCI